MTIRIPKWLLGVAGVLVIIAIAGGAYLLGKGEDNSGSGEPAATAPAECNRAVARKVLSRRNPAVGLDSFSIAGGRTFDSYSLGPVECADLTGDGTDEMVVRLYFQTLSGSAPWFIYGNEDGRWDLKLRRMLSGRDSIRVKDGVVKESAAAYAPGESLSSPSSERVGRVSWDGEKFIYESREGIGTGEVRFAGARAQAIGGMPVIGSYLPDAIDRFGPPSMYGGPEDEVCNAQWNDIGLIINFVNLGGGLACEDGAIQTFLITREAAEQAGWRVGPSGLAVGDRQDAIRSEYPQMAPGPDLYGTEEQQGAPGRDWSLITVRNPYTGGRLATLSARMSRGTAVAYVIYVGAAGE